MTIRCTDLRCERLVDPIGLDTRAPRLAWRLEVDDETNVEQRSFRVETEGGWAVKEDGWRQQVTYDGPLQSREAVRWRVRVTTAEGETEWSPWATFEVGILDASEWSASMVTATAATPVVRFATPIDVPDDVVTARLRIASRGIAYASIDGVDVSDDVLQPGWTSYRTRVAVRTYDVTSQLASGASELAITVAPGWFSGPIGFGGADPIYGRHVGALAQLELTRADDSLVIVDTDDTWTASATPWSLAEIYDGEAIDARAPIVGEPAKVSVVGDFDPAVLFAPAVPPCRRTEELASASWNGSIVDFGQNLVGWIRLTVRGAAPGTEIVLRHAELLDNDGQLFTAPLRLAKATDTYIARGDAEETYEPRFTFHGFRYAELHGIDPSQVDVVAVVVHSDLERTGTFACSEPLLERLHENVVWG
ncbi:MAG: alpha-L-rhamnosidase, partial [Actinomycetota bacterium]